MSGPAQSRIVPEGIKFVDLAWSAMDVTLFLVKEAFDFGADGRPTATPSLRHPVGALSISPVMAKALAKDLAAAVEAYERQFGPIPAPEPNANVVPLRPVEPTDPAPACEACGSEEGQGCLKPAGLCEAPTAVTSLVGPDVRNSPAAECVPSAEPLTCTECGHQWSSYHHAACSRRGLVCAQDCNA